MKRAGPYVFALFAVIAAIGVILILRSRANHAPRALRLADGTQALFLGDTRVEPARTYPAPREIRVDGDAFIRTGAISTQLIVRTRLLVLKVDANTALRVTAFSSEDGEQAEVLQGQVQAQKSYPSYYSEPDLLGAGEMSMINRTIDLLEKEKFDPGELRKWSEQLRQAAARADPVSAPSH